MPARSTSKIRATAITAALAPLLLVVAVALKTIGEPVRPEDLWWHLGMGRVIASLGAIPEVDVFSFTRAGAPYFDQPWLAQLALYAGHRAFGLAGLLAAGFATVLVAQALTIGTARVRGARFDVACAVLLALAPLAARGWSLRPQVLAVPIFAAFVHVLARFRARRAAPLGLLPVLAVAWANVHGSFPLGVVLVVGALVAVVVDGPARDARARRGALAVTALGCAVAPLVNPRGVALYAYVARLTRDPAVRAFSREWQPPTWGDAEGIAVGLTWLAIALGAAWILVTRRRPTPQVVGDVLLLLPFFVLARMAVRNGIWASLVAGPIVASWIAPGGAVAADGAASPTSDRPSRRVVAVWTCCVAIGLALPWIKPRVVRGPYGALVWHRRTPIAAAAVLARDPSPPRRLFHDAGVGSYLVWAVPRQRVFVDPRFELYPVPLWEDALALLRADDVDARIARHGIDGFLLDAVDDAPLLAVLRWRPDFELRYEDADAAYFVRR